VLRESISICEKVRGVLRKALLEREKKKGFLSGGRCANNKERRGYMTKTLEKSRLF